MKRTSKHLAPKSVEVPAKDASKQPPSESELSVRVDALRALDLDGLRREFLAVMGRPTNSKDRDAMIQRIGERLVLGGKRAPGRPIGRREQGTPGSAAPTRAPKAPSAAAKRDAASPFTQDPRLPAPGSTITVTHKKKEYSAKFLGADGFEYEGTRYRSLSAIASKILGGAAVNGFLWWGLTARPEAGTTEKPSAEKGARPRRAPKRKAK